MHLAGRIAIVTGSGGAGCGRAIARRLAWEGASVVVTDIDEAGARQTLTLIEAEGGRAALWVANVAVEAEVRALIAFAESTFGGLDVVVNNASGPGYHPETPFDHWIETIQTDLFGAIYMTLHSLDCMRRRGGGAVVSMGSVSAIGHGRKHAEVPGYDVAKAGVIRLTTTLARLQRENIRVNCLVPGWIASPEVQGYVDSLTPEQRRQRGVPNTLITTDQITDAVVELATDEALAGRVMVWWNDQPRRLIPAGDPGYERLEER
jgi:NAD(P)-dependent dehydrogenase (short-subunit alcohol dehydrogenase family)